MQYHPSTVTRPVTCPCGWALIPYLVGDCPAALERQPGANTTEVIGKTAMSTSTSDKKALAARHIQQAIDTGVRKELRTTLLRALELATDEAPKEITQLHYHRLALGARLADPHRPRAHPPQEAECFRLPR